jgi:hypothetical protein
VIRPETLARLHDDARLRAGMFALWCIGWLAIVALSLIPVGIPGPSGTDKVLHLGVHAAMTMGGLAFCRTARGLVLVALACVVIGITIELAQGLVPYRHMSPADVVANTTGALLGLAAALWALPRLRGLAARG